MTIAAILAGKGHEVVTVTADHSVADALAVLADRRIGAVPVMADDGVAGVFSERDVILCLAREGASALDKSVGEVMTTPAVIVAPGDRALAGLSLMTRRRIRHLPVVDGGHLVGLVSIGDLVKYRIDKIEADAAAMRDYIQSV
ncbi:CBS domain-containing protein [Hephaestia sp. GCM10023244]|uniref:CBS domain-containing protein n=1 Tax=unclassified Hephaestia TaxID=2631281 RepID=UPI0020779BF7|nr:CBS domain-containing protein [Hephaestia sp. MAHUQ-44]MCM8730922.1 CBS domain-containing protein [Hephaestia sp. MAHUQ-44]